MNALSQRGGTARSKLRGLWRCARDCYFVGFRTILLRSITATPVFLVGRRVMVMGPWGRSMAPAWMVLKSRKSLVGSSFIAMDFALVNSRLISEPGGGPPREYSRVMVKCPGWVMVVCQVRWSATLVQ